MKYIKQKTKYDCGPVALMNAHIHFGTKVSYKSSIVYFKHICGYQDYYGTDIKKFSKLLLNHKNYTFPFTVEYLIQNPTINQLREHVNKKQCVILGIDNKNWTHVGLLVKMTKCYVTLANWGGDKVVMKVHIKTLKKWLSEWSLAYVIQKKE